MIRLFISLMLVHYLIFLDSFESIKVLMISMIIFYFCGVWFNVLYIIKRLMYSPLNQNIIRRYSCTWVIIEHYNDLWTVWQVTFVQFDYTFILIYMRVNVVFFGSCLLLWMPKFLFFENLSTYFNLSIPFSSITKVICDSFPYDELDALDEPSKPDVD